MDGYYDWSQEPPKPVKPVFWTDDKVEILRRWWLWGVRTVVIASELGTTKNAVIGKGTRIGLTGLHGSEPRPAQIY
jgi:hypothetical protein